MRSVAIACVKNEIDIVEPFVRHTVAIVDRLVILDNGSQDGTLDVLRALRKEGLPLDVVEDPLLGKYQSQRMTRLMHEWAIGRHDADWVVALDGDEFLVIPQDAPLVPGEIDGDRPIAVPWRTYVAGPSDDVGQLNPVLRIRSRRVANGWEASKVMVPRTLAALPNATIAQGSHEIFVDGRCCEPRRHESGYLAHFPLRSAGQYAAKIALNSLQYQTMAERNWQWAFHYKEPFELLKRDLRAFTASFTTVAMHYAAPREARIEAATVIDPICYRGGPLRYTPPVDDISRPWQTLLSYAEDLARRYAVLAGGLTGGQQLAMEQQAAIVAGLYDQLEQQRKHLACFVDQAAAAREEQQKQAAAARAEQQKQVAALAANLDAQLAEAKRQRLEMEEQLRVAGSQLARVSRSWTWRIGRLVVGPAAWANRSQRRCLQALTSLHLRTSPKRLPIPNLQIHVAHSCNLHCESCSHYANQGHRGIVALDEAERWMRLWNRRLSPQIFALLGGEPAMHPQLTEFVRMARKYWPEAELQLITNGLLLKRHHDLPAALRETDTCVCLSIHHGSRSYQEKLRPVLELVETWERSQGIRVQYLHSHRVWTRRYKGFGSAMEPFDDGQPRLSWENCVAKGCYQLFEGKIWRCAPLAYLKLQAAKYELSERWQPYLNYQPLPPECTPEELAAFLAKEEEPCCGMCAREPQALELPLPMTVPFSAEPRRKAA